ncbi:MAG: type VI secretion system tube protein Hcp [Bacteroidota bacterium]|nr:type VI secretion system tube protein Hcp [Bacteroidota bacterium]
MKKILISLLCLFVFTLCHAQLKVFVKFTLYDNTPLVSENSYDRVHKGELLLTTYADNDEQTLNIGSQSTGAGAGKVVFNPTTFSKLAGANSAKFFQMMASGTPFKFAEYNFYNSADQLVFRVTLKLVAIKAIQRAAATCSGNCPGVIENYSVEYGGKVITVFVMSPDGTPGTSYTYGWNRVKNIADNDPTTSIN